MTPSDTDHRQMFPGTAHLRPDLPANKIMIDMDSWIETEWKGSLDVLTYGAVCGVVQV